MRPASGRTNPASISKIRVLPEPLGPNATSAYAKLIKDSVNLRRTPSASGTSLGRIPVNTLLLVTGTDSATAVVRCVRCLREFDQELEVEVRELFALQPGEDEDEGYAVLPDDRLPLDTMARDALVLDFPAFPLHSPDCAGLCPTCGADRNTTDCGHGGTEGLDPRWAALAGLQDSLEEDNDASPQA